MTIQEALQTIWDDNPHLQTQNALAEFLGISGPMVNTYLKGKSRPSFDTAVQIYKRSGIQVEPFTERSLKEAAS